MTPLSQNIKHLGLELLRSFARGSNLYFAGKLVAVWEGSGAYAPQSFTAVVTDRLGSVRVRNGVKTSYYPYGVERTTPVWQGGEKYATYTRDHWTGGNDSESLDYADQRYYGSRFGRFVSADPYLASGGAGDPGSWNRYAYVGGDPVNYGDPTGEVRISREGGVPHWPIPFVIFGLGKIFGAIFGGGRDPVIESWRNNTGANVAAWDARIAADEQSGENQDRRYIAALKVVGDCYQTSTLGGAAVRRFHYLPVDQYGKPFARGEVTVSESIYVTQGGSVTAGAPWTPDKMEHDGSFFDYVSKFYRGNKDVIMYQTFQATMLNSAGFAPGVPRAVMVQYEGYGNEHFGVLGHWATNDGVKTNNYFHNPTAGRTTCPNPRFP